MVEIKWSKRALTDLNEISKYIGLNSKKYASITLEKIFSMVDILESYPNLGKIVPEINESNIREITFKQYRIIYQLEINYLYIIAVHHSSKDFSIQQIASK